MGIHRLVAFIRERNWLGHASQLVLNTCIQTMCNACSMLKNHITEGREDEVKAVSLCIGFSAVSHCLDRTSDRAMNSGMGIEIGEFA